MTPITIIDQAAAEGVAIKLTPAGTLKIGGNRTTVNRWLPIIQAHKPDILAALTATTGESHLAKKVKPVCCVACQHFQPDTIGDGTGIGDCQTGHKPRGGNEPPLYPRARRYCASFKQR